MTQTPDSATPDAAPSGIRIRHDLQPGDIARIVAAHGLSYAQEYGYDWRFEAYVAASLGDLAVAADAAAAGDTAPPCRVWLAERADETDGELLGILGMVGRDEAAVQLRWCLVSPAARGRGLGHWLVADALRWSRASGFTHAYLWTVHPLTAAARIYTAAGFVKTETKPLANLWGQRLAEERYDLHL